MTKLTSTEAQIAKYGLKPVDAWWTVLVIDPIAIRLVDVLRSVAWVSPNLVSAVSILTGVAAAVAFAGTEFLWGAVLYQIRFLLDCVDGKLARARGQKSRLGWYLDHRTAFPMMVLTIACWSYGLYRIAWDPFWAVIAMFSVVALANFLLFANEAIGGAGDEAARPARWGRLAPRPTGVEFETLVLTVFPVLLHFGSSLAVPAFWLGLLAFVLYAGYMQVKDLRTALRP